MPAGKEMFHYDCAGITTSGPHDEWWCLQCTILQNQHVKTVRHIPNGVSIQVALALSQLLEACTSEGCGILPWQRVFSFAASALAVPQATPSSSPVSTLPPLQRNTSLSTIIKSQVNSFMSISTSPSPSSPERRERGRN